MAKSNRGVAASTATATDDASVGTISAMAVLQDTAGSGTITKITVMTAATYAALGSKVATTLYVIVG
jgi:hypothetical protein